MEPKTLYLFSRSRLLFIVLLLLFSFRAEAATPNQSTYNAEKQPSTLTQPSVIQDAPWRFTIAPYLWAVNMNGSTQVKGKRASVNQSFSDILSDLNWGAMVWLEAEKGKWGGFFNITYASLSDGASAGLVSAHANVQFSLYTAGLSYEAYKACLCSGGCQWGGSTLALVPYVGGRYTLLNNSLTLNTPLGNARGSDIQHWIDPILGLRLNFDLTKAWKMTLGGDVGGTNTNSDVSYNVWGVIGYNPQSFWKCTTWYLGYRLLDQKYKHGTSSNYFLWDMKIYGPLIGVAFNF